MGKAEVGTPKYLANKMKAKGLQKLRWYCQMCEKQCRDENGFKCHTQSESHQRQLLLFADNSGKYIHSFSKEFSDGYVELLRRRFGTKRVAANKVYQEYISHKDHLHMNATKWLTLSDYVTHLGRTGVCVVDETEKGWYVTYIDRSPEVLERQEKAARKEKQDKDDEERHMEHIRQQIERDAKASSSKHVEYTEIKRTDDAEKIKLSIKSNKVNAEPLLQIPFNSKKRRNDDSGVVDDEDGDTAKMPRPSTSGSSRGGAKKRETSKLSALDEIMRTEEYKKEKTNRKNYWLAEGIVVKLITKALGDKFYKKKGLVVEVVDKYGAKVKMLETGEKVKVDQSHCETVIPTCGKLVRVLNGAYRGSTAVLNEIDEDNYCVSIEIASGPLKGRQLKNIQYEDISKLFQE